MIRKENDKGAFYFAKEIESKRLVYSIHTIIGKLILN